MIDAFFTPIPENLWAPMKGKNQYIGGKIKLYSTAFPKLKKTQIAIIGLGESSDVFRKHFYDLTWRFGNLEIADLGNLVETKDEKQKKEQDELKGKLASICIERSNGRAYEFKHYSASNWRQ